MLVVHSPDIVHGDIQRILDVLSYETRRPSEFVVRGKLEGLPEHAGYAVVETGFRTSLDSIEIGLGKTVLFEHLQRREDRRPDIVEIGVRKRSNANPERAGDLVAALGCRHRRGELLIFYEHLVQWRVLAVRKKSSQHLERIGVFVKALHRREDHSQLRRTREIVFVKSAARFGQGHGHRLRIRDRIGRRQISEILLDPCPCLCKVKVTGYHEGHVVRAVPFLEERPHVVHSRALQVLERSDDLPIVRVSLGIE